MEPSAHSRECFIWDAIDNPEKMKKTTQAGLLGVDQLEPVQFAFQWMPVICLENYLGTSVVNRTTCYIVRIVPNKEEDDERLMGMVDDEAQEGEEEEEQQEEQEEEASLFF